MPINRPMPRPAVKTPTPQPQFNRAAPRPMAKPTTPPPMGGVMGGRPAPGPKAPPAPAPAFSGGRPAQMAKPPAQPGMMGALQSRLQGARPQQKPMGQQAGGFVSQQQPMKQLAESNVAVRMAGPDYPVGQQFGIDTGSGREMLSRTADNYIEERYVDPLTGREVGQPTGGQQVMPDDMRVRQEMALRNRNIMQAGRQMPMPGNTFAAAPQRLDMTQRLNNMFVPGQRG